MRENFKVLFIGLLIFFIGSSAAGQVTKTKPANQKTSALKKDYRVWHDTVYTYKSWRTLDTTGYKYSTKDYTICLDTKGIIYLISNKKIYKVADDKFIDISPNNEPCFSFYLSEKDELLMETWGQLDTPVDREYKTRYYLYKAGVWQSVTDKTFIAAFKNENSSGYNRPGRLFSNKPKNPAFLKNVGYLNYPNNRYLFCGSSDTKGFIYEFVNSQWKKLSEFTWGNLISNDVGSRRDLFYTDHGLYCLINGTLHKQDTSFTVSITKYREYDNKKVPIVVAEEVKKDAEEEYPAYIGIFEENGKLGLRTISGKIVAHPVFKSITFEKNPSPEAEHIYLFRLKGDGMDVYSLMNNDDPDHLISYMVSADACIKCNGLGKVNKAPCTACDGGKRAVTITRYKYEFDKSSRKYIRRLDISYSKFGG